MITATEPMTQELVFAQNVSPATCPHCGCLPNAEGSVSLGRCRICNTEMPEWLPPPGRSESAIRFEKMAEDIRCGSMPIVHGLFCAVARAEHFIHYRVEGMDPGVVSILRDAVNKRVTVRGVAGVTDSHAPARPGGERLLGGTALVVVDGQVAFKGPGVLSCSIWARAALLPGIVRVTADSREVARWNNRLFSPLWKEQGIHPYGANQPGASQ